MIRRPRGLRRAAPRGGAAMLEFALVFPVFMCLVFALLEFGRAFMVVQLLNTACRVAARAGVVDGATTAGIKQEMIDFLKVARIEDGVQVYVIDGSGFDKDAKGSLSISDLIKNYPASEKDMSEASPRSLAIFRVEVPYDKVALITPVWLMDVTLFGQVVMRRE